jgi:hypothetical protein
VNPSQEPESLPPRSSDQPVTDPTASAGVPGSDPVYPGPGYHGGDTAPAEDSGPHYGLAHPYGLGADGPAVTPRSRRPWQRGLKVTVLTALAILVLGGPLGLIWAWLAPSVPVIDAGSGGFVVNDPSPEEYIAADGWYTILGLAFGLIVAVVAWLVLRRDRGPFLLLGVVIGTLGAGYLVAPKLGQLIGRGAYNAWRHTAAQGATYMAPPQVHSIGPLLVPAFAAAIALTLLAGWSNDPDLDDPGARPGSGPNTTADEASRQTVDS